MIAVFKIYIVKRDNLTDEQKDFLFWYEYKMPVGIGACAMNKICWYVESQLTDINHNCIMILLLITIV